MEFSTHIQNLSAHPIPHQVLVSLFKDYKRPNDKIHSLIREQKLIPLKKALYVWNSDALPEKFSIANVLYAPSYVSAESALSFYGLIPERVYSTVSITVKTPRKFTNDLGDFDYIKLPSPYYSFGIKRVELRENQFALMATPEKALMDKVITTSGILLRSEKSAKEYLMENLRIEFEQLKSLDLSEMKIWSESAPKKESINYIIKAIENL